MSRSGGSRENGDRFSITEAAKTQPSNEGSLRTCYPGKTFWILILQRAIAWAFEFYEQDIGQVSRLRHEKFTLMFNKFSIFKKFDRFM